MTRPLPVGPRALNRKLSHRERSRCYGHFVRCVPIRAHQRGDEGAAQRPRLPTNRNVTLPNRFSLRTDPVGPGVTCVHHNPCQRDNEVIPAVKTTPECNETEDGDVVLEASRPPAPEKERSRVKLVAGDPPMLRLEINLYSWERGDSEIDVVLPHGGELSDLLHWALPEQRLVICGNLRARIQEELAEVFNVLLDPAD